MTATSATVTDAIRGVLRLRKGLESLSETTAGALTDIPCLVGLRQDLVVNTLKQVLRSAAESLDGTYGFSGIPKKDLALAALGVGKWSTTVGLHERLRQYTEPFHLGKSTYMGYIREMAPDLAGIVLTLDHIPASDPTSLGYVLIRNEHTHVIANRRPTHTFVTLELRPTEDAIDTYQVHSLYPNDLDGDVVTVTAVSNCRLVDEKNLVTGAHTAYLKIPTTEVGELVSFRYLIEVASTKPDRPYLRHRARTTTNLLMVSVQFEHNDLPTSIWPFSALRFDQEPHESRDAAAFVSPNSIGYVEHVFTGVTRDQNNGLAWDWAQSGTSFP